MNEAPLLTVTQAAELLQCSKRSVYNLMKKQDFPKVKVKGLGTRIVRERLIPWLCSPAANKPAKVRVSKSGVTP